MFLARFILFTAVCCQAAELPAFKTVTVVRDLKMGYASAMAWIQLLIILALTGFAFWSSRRWVHYQGR